MARDASTGAVPVFVRARIGHVRGRDARQHFVCRRRTRSRRALSSAARRAAGRPRRSRSAWRQSPGPGAVLAVPELPANAWSSASWWCRGGRDRSRRSSRRTVRNRRRTLCRSRTSGRDRPRSRRPYRKRAVLRQERHGDAVAGVVVEPGTAVGAARVRPGDRVLVDLLTGLRDGRACRRRATTSGRRRRGTGRRQRPGCLRPSRRRLRVSRPAVRKPREGQGRRRRLAAGAR